MKVKVQNELSIGDVVVQMVRFVITDQKIIQIQ